MCSPCARRASSGREDPPTPYHPPPPTPHQGPWTLQAPTYKLDPAPCKYKVLTFQRNIVSLRDHPLQVPLVWPCVDAWSSEKREAARRVSGPLYTPARRSVAASSRRRRQQPHLPSESAWARLWPCVALAMLLAWRPGRNSVAWLLLAIRARAPSHLSAGSGSSSLVHRSYRRATRSGRGLLFFVCWQSAD